MPFRASFRTRIERNLLNGDRITGMILRMSRIYVPTRGPSDWRALLGDPEKHWKAGYSAMAAARSWETAKGVPPEIAKIMGPAPDLLLAIPEHKVPLPGRGAASQCDVFALIRDREETVSLAVEAKVAEPFDKPIGEWLRDGSDGRRTRLAAICDLLGCGLPPGDLYYQLFHRTAAAVIEARRFGTDAAAMIVQSFSQEHLWFDQFSAFCAFLGVDAAREKRLTRDLPGGGNLILGWATGEARFLEPVAP
ncbi:DUF6946 family protein [Acidimangrovimonas pyrenivorans]|uniref:DUF6946 family protein n=1 Tax=Acidimangrovimonas pyrenivorans TaxID=2030798 RepID=A0ABV7AD54_9RHOB